MTEKLNVYECIAKCAQEIATTGIAKDRKNDMQGYKFRGIDDVYNALAPIISKNGLVILPRVLSRQVVERQTAKGGTVFYTTVESEFDFVSMFDQSKHVVKTYGEAMDSGDKSTNKAMSAAYKYACMQAFCIPTEGDNDADATTHEVKQNPFTPENKSLQAEVITKIALSKDEAEIQSVLDEYDVSKLPEEMQGLINDQLDNRRQQIMKGINPEVKSHKFAGVDDQRNWVKRMLPVIKSIKTPEVLADWKLRNAAFIQGLADKGTVANPIAPRAFFLEELDKRAAELNPIG